MRWSIVVPACLFVTTVVAAGADVRVFGPSQQAPPVLRTGVDLVTIDVQVALAKGATLRELTAADFEISIGGRKRPASSVTRLHDDAGTIVRDRARGSEGSTPECVFGFHRQADRTTVHYLVGVERIDSDRKDVKDVRVKAADKAIEVQQYLWRSPVPRRASLPHVK